MAAQELAAAGASRVLLFGSLARGEARDASDIDLVAVFDDIDYSRRSSLKDSLSSTAEAAVGRPVEVFVTDRPEWRRRTREVTASFEAGIAPAAVVLVERPAGEVRWDKEIGLPDTNLAEALGRLDETAKALDLMTARMLPSEGEAQAFMSGDHHGEEHRRRWRLIDVCSSAAMALETSLKALAALAGAPVPHKHRIDLLIPLAGDRRAVRAALDPLEHNTLRAGQPPYDDITIWRKAGTYISDRPDIAPDAAARLAPQIAAAALNLAAIAADAIAAEAGDDPAVERARRIAGDAARVLDTRDLTTGGPRQPGHDRERRRPPAAGAHPD